MQGQNEFRYSEGLRSLSKATELAAAFLTFEETGCDYGNKEDRRLEILIDLFSPIVTPLDRGLIEEQFQAFTGGHLVLNLYGIRESANTTAVGGVIGAHVRQEPLCHIHMFFRLLPELSVHVSILHKSSRVMGKAGRWYIVGNPMSS